MSSLSHSRPQGVAGLKPQPPGSGAGLEGGCELEFPGLFWGLSSSFDEQEKTGTSSGTISLAFSPGGLSFMKTKTHKIFKLDE